MSSGKLQICCLWMEMLMLLRSPGFAVVGLGSDHWPLSSLPKMFPCRYVETFMTHIYGVVCYTEMRHEH